MTEMTLAELEEALAQRPAPPDACDLMEAVVSHHRATASGSSVPLARALHGLGHMRLQNQQEQAALAAWDHACDLLNSPQQEVAGANLNIDVLIDKGGLLCAMQDGSAAEAPLLEATALLKAAGAATPRFVWAYNLLATAYQLTERPEDGLAALRQSEQAARMLAKATRADRDAANLALILNNIGRAQITLGRVQEACYTLLECLEVTRSLIEDGNNQHHLILHSAVSNRYGCALEQTGQLDAALPYQAEAAGIMRQLVSSGRGELADDLHQVEADLGRVRTKLAHQA